jgi:hypothetical protein
VLLVALDGRELSAAALLAVAAEPDLYEREDGVFWIAHRGSKDWIISTSIRRSVTATRRRPWL